MKTIKHISILAILLFSLNTIKAQNWLWARDGGSVAGASSRLLTVNPKGNIYFFGGFVGTIALDSANISSGGSNNGYILSSTTDGMFIKGTRIIPYVDIHGQQSGLSVHNLDNDLSENIYLTGEIKGTVGFDTLNAYGYYDGYLVKFDSSLHGLGIKKASSIVYSVAFDSQKNTYLAGTINSAVNYIDTFALYNSNSSPALNPKMFLAKLDSTGKCLWVKQGYGGDSRISKICIKNENVYLYGYMDSCVSFDTVNHCGLNSFVMKTDTDGNVKWFSTYTYLDHGYFTSIDVDANSNCYVIGGFDSTMYLPGHTLTKAPGSDNNSFLAKYDSLGAILWVKQFYSDSAFHFDKMDTDDDGNTYVLGYFTKTGVFLDDTIAAQTGRDMFITRLSNSGAYLGIKILPSKAKATDIAQDADGNAIVTGNLNNGTTNFGSIPLTCTGQSNFFLAKLEAIDGTTNTIRILAQDNSLKIYPNPNAKAFTIEVPEGLVQSNTAQLGIYNSTGGVIKEEAVDITNNKAGVDIGMVQKGIYTVILSSGQKKFTGRVVVE